MLVSNKFYTTESFSREAAELGVSKRISSIPRKLKLGETWLFLAYMPTEKTERPLIGEPKGKQVVFFAFVPTRIELVVSPSWRAENAEQVAHYEKRGVALVEVPDDDPDHQPTTRRKPWEVKED